MSTRTRALALALAAVVAAPAQAAIPTRGTDPYLATGNLGYDVRNYNVALTYSAPGHDLGASRAEVTAVATTTLRSFSMDFSSRLAISSVQIAGQGVRFSRSGAKLLVTPRAAILTGKAFTVSVRYSGRPGAHADTSGRGSIGWIRTAGGVVTYDEPDGTYEWVPSNDVFYDKATWTLRLTTPKGMLGVATGRYAGRVDTSATTTSTFVQDQPITPYQQVVAFDTFSTSTASIAGIRAFTASSVKPSAGGSPTPSVAVMQARTAEAISWLRARLGAFPYADTGAIVVSGGGSAMETAGRPTYSNNDDFLFARETVVHEIAHQWFSGRFTATNVADVWLHEGFATWLEREWQSMNGGGETRPAYLRRNYLTDGFADNKTGQFGTVSVEAPTNAYRLESTVYYRGAAALEALRVQIGAGPFGQLLRQLAQAPAGRTYTTSQFVALASRISGVNLNGWRAQWLQSKEIQPLPFATTPQEVANELGLRVGIEVYNQFPATLDGPALAAAVAQAKADFPRWVPLKVTTAGATSSGVYAGTPVTRITLSVPPGPLYAAGATACVTIPSNLGADGDYRPWFSGRVRLSADFARDSVTLQACPASG